MTLRKYILPSLCLVIIFMNPGCLAYRISRALTDHSMYASPAKGLLDTCDTKECLTLVTKTDPNNALAHWRLGQKFLFDERNYSEAIRELDIAIQLDSTNSFAYRDRAICKNNLRDDQGAVEDMNAAIRQNPTERYFYVDRGQYYHNLQKSELALNDFSKALAIWNKYTPARVWRAREFTILGKYSEASADYDTLNFSNDYVNNPDHAYDIYLRGLARFHTNQKEKACMDWATVSGNSKEAKTELEKNCK